MHEDIDSQSKVFIINIKKAKGLRREDINDKKHMEPFFSFQFYRFDAYRSATLTGSDVEWNYPQKYEVQYTKEFVEYLSRNEIQIHFCDESIDISNN